MKIVYTIPYIDDYDSSTDYTVGGIEYSSIENLKKDILVAYEIYKEKERIFHKEYGLALDKIMELRSNPEYMALREKYYSTAEEKNQVVLLDEMDKINKRIAFPAEIDKFIKVKGLTIILTENYPFDIEKCEFCELEDWFDKVTSK